MIVALIAAVARNGIIGKDGGLPWRLPTDLGRFKALTLGKPLVMGRKTYDSIGRPLPGRRIIVVTRQTDWRRDGVEVAHDLDGALRLTADAPEVMIGGGGEIYREALPRAGRLYLTEVNLAPEDGVRFPELDLTEWRETLREIVPRGASDEADFGFVNYERLPRPGR